MITKFTNVTIISLIYFVYISFLLMSLIPPTCSHELVFHINDFDVVELDLYNDMISCVANFKEQFIKCNRNIKNLGLF